MNKNFGTGNAFSTTRAGRRFFSKYISAEVFAPLVVILLAKKLNPGAQSHRCPNIQVEEA